MADRLTVIVDQSLTILQRGKSVEVGVDGHKCERRKTEKEHKKISTPGRVLCVNCQQDGLNYGTKERVECSPAFTFDANSSFRQ